MKTKTIKVYEFDELNKEAKEKVLEYFREQEEHHSLNDNLEELLKEKLKENNIEILKDLSLYYSLSYCQGDGACFTGLFKWKDFSIEIKHEERYYHERSTEISLYNDKLDDESTEKDDDEFKEIYYKICLELKKFGYAEIEANLEEENIKETIEANGCTFRENGKIENI